MAGKNLDYWYDEQIKRYLIQLIRIFSNFKVKENTKNGIKYNRVPARYGDAQRMVSSILRNNSENVINSAPFISVNISSIQPARDRTHEPFLVDTNQVAEREWDNKAGNYTSEQGNLVLFLNRLQVRSALIHKVAKVRILVHRLSSISFLPRFVLCIPLS